MKDGAHMSDPKTLLQFAGADLSANSFSDSILLTIDQQNEYVFGELPLYNIDSALSEAAVVLENARAAGAPIIHIVQAGRSGGLFDLQAARGQIVDTVMPHAGERVIRKIRPNSFSETTLEADLRQTGRTNLIVTGFMTHMCVSSTVRAALDLGFRTTIVAGATATRDLPSISGGPVINAGTLSNASLAALADRFAVIVPAAKDLKPG